MTVEITDPRTGETLQQEGTRVGLEDEAVDAMIDYLDSKNAYLVRNVLKAVCEVGTWTWGKVKLGEAAAVTRIGYNSYACRPVETAVRLRLLHQTWLEGSRGYHYTLTDLGAAVAG